MSTLRERMDAAALAYVDACDAEGHDPAFSDATDIVLAVIVQAVVTDGVEGLARYLRDVRYIEDDANQRILREPTRQEARLTARAVAAYLRGEES